MLVLVLSVHPVVIFVSKHPVYIQEYKLVITGHSLGAGVAAVLALLMQDDSKYHGLQCFAFSPPGGLMRSVASIVLLHFSVVLR